MTNTSIIQRDLENRWKPEKTLFFRVSLTKGLFKTSRCIIPASGFIEGQNKKYHFIEGKNKALAIGGIYKTYQFDDKIITTASIITCPGNPQLADIHKKSIPLLLDYEDKNLIDAWLSPQFTESQAFAYLLDNKIRQHLIATPIQAARNLKAIGEPVQLIPD